MPPYPKHPSVRARRNQPSTATELQIVNPDDLEVPALPARLVQKKVDGEVVKVEAEWHPMAVASWVEVWTSPMTAEFLEADFGGIRMLLAMEHAFWEKMEAGRSVTELAAEISRVRKQYGLAPMGRRSLQWTIAQTQDTMNRNARRRGPDAIEGTAVTLEAHSSDDEVAALLEMGE